MIEAGGPAVHAEPGEGPHRALRPDALPADTSVRFMLLVLAVATASVYLFQALWFAFRGQRFADVARECAGAAGGLADRLQGTATAELQRQTACQSGVSREQTAFAVGGALLVLAVAWVTYRVRPAWRERRHHLQGLDPVDGAALSAELGVLAASAGLGPPPRIRLDAPNPGVQAFVYGAGADLRMGVTGGLVVQQVLDPAGFRAVLRHELGHVANRDVPWTYFTVSVWWAFLGVAVLPVVVVFAVSDPTYVVRLGWRTLLLALLVAVVSAGLLRARESYADARAAEWGSGPDLDRILGGQRAPSGRRPGWLRVHPAPAARRALLADPDGLFGADGLVALTTGVAAGTAFATLQAIAYLAFSNAAAVVVPAVAVALPVAVVLCVTSWRVGLREAVRDVRVPFGLRLGVWLGVGLAAAPVLTLQAAVGDFAEGARGWAGYAVWSGATVVVTVLLVNWVADSSRLRVASVLATGSPRRALVVHVGIASLLFALLFTVGAYALPVLTTLGPTYLTGWEPWVLLPQAMGGRWLGLVPAVTVAGAVGLALASRWDLGSERDLGREQAPGRPGRPAGWFWRDGAGGDGALEEVEGLPSGPGRLAPLVWIGAAAGAAAGLALVAARLLSVLRDDSVRSSEAFVIELGHGQTAAVMAAALAAGAAVAVLVPARWWPLGLLAGGVAGVVAGSAAVMVNVAAGCGLLPAVHHFCAAPDTGLVNDALVQPLTEAASVTFLVVAAVGALRAVATDRSRGPSAARGGRAVVAGVLAAVVAVGWTAAAGAGVLAVQPVVVVGPGYTVEVPGEWEGAADPQTGAVTFVTTAQDARVAIVPVDEAAPSAGGDPVLVGGLQAWPVARQVEGVVEQRAYDVQGPQGVYRIIVEGASVDLALRGDELTRLFAAVRWATG